MVLEIGARLGPFEVTGSLGAGGMNEVYRAHDTNLDPDVALKIRTVRSIHASFPRRPETAMRILQRAVVLVILVSPIAVAGLATPDTPGHQVPTVAVTTGPSPSCGCFTAGWQAASVAVGSLALARQRCASRGPDFAAAFDAGASVARMPGAPAQPGSCPVACDCYGYGWMSAADPYVQTLGGAIPSRSQAEVQILTVACQGLGFDGAYQQGRSAGTALLRASAAAGGQVDVLAFLSTPPGPCPSVFGPSSPAQAAPVAGGPGMGGRAAGGSAAAPPVSVYTGPSVNEGRLARRDPAVDAWVRDIQSDSSAVMRTRTISIHEAVGIARSVHDGLGFNLGWASTRDERIDFWVAAVSAVHHGHPIYNPLGGDPDWCVKNAGGGRPTTDDVIVRCSSREAWDCISGAGAEGYTFEASPIGHLPPDQQVFAPPVGALP